jgi:hypothetical protein
VGSPEVFHRCGPGYSSHSDSDWEVLVLFLCFRRFIIILILILSIFVFAFASAAPPALTIYGLKMEQLLQTQQTIPVFVIRMRLFSSKSKEKSCRSFSFSKEIRATWFC